jgi:hypothetical protein
MHAELMDASSTTLIDVDSDLITIYGRRNCRELGD